MRTSDGHKEQQLSYSDKSNGNKHDNNNVDSNMARGKVLRTFDFGYDNIKDREMNNGNEERDKNNDRYYNITNQRQWKKYNNDDKQYGIAKI